MKSRFDINYNLPKYTILEDKLYQAFGKKLKTISDIADVVCGPFGSAIKNSDYQDSGIPLIRITNITKDGYMNYDDLIFISEKLGDSLSRTQVSPGDIVISQRGSLGQCAIVGSTLPKMNISANIIAIKNINGVSASFLHDYFLSTLGQALLERSVSGQVQQKITTQDIADLLIPIDTDETKLTAILDYAYTSYKSKIQQAEDLLAGMSSYIFDILSIAPIKFNFQLCCKVKMTDLISDKTFSAEYYHPERMAAISNMKAVSAFNVRKLIDIVDFCRDVVSCSENSKKYLGLAGVESQTGELSGTDEEASGQAFSYDVDDVLYGRLRPYLNKVLLAEESGICSTEFHVMRAKDQSVVLPEYLASIMRSDLILSQTKHMMTGNTHPRISNDDVQNLYVPVPDISVQRIIVNELKKRRTQVRRLKQEAEQEWAAAKAKFEKELLGE